MKHLQGYVLENIIDTDDLLKYKPIRKGNASNENFFKWLKYDIFSPKFDKYKELYENILFRNFGEKVNINEYNEYSQLHESKEDEDRHINEMKLWLSELKNFERPYFRVFINTAFSDINKKYYIEAQIGYNNSRNIRVFTDKIFTKLN